MFSSSLVSSLVFLDFLNSPEPLLVLPPHLVHQDVGLVRVNDGRRRRVFVHVLEESPKLFVGTVSALFRFCLDTGLAFRLIFFFLLFRLWNFAALSFFPLFPFFFLFLPFLFLLFIFLLVFLAGLEGRSIVFRRFRMTWKIIIRELKKLVFKNKFQVWTEIGTRWFIRWNKIQIPN